MGPQGIELIPIKWLYGLHVDLSFTRFQMDFLKTVYQCLSL